MLSFTTSDELEIEDLPELKKEAAETGGRLILYQIVLSAVVMSSATPMLFCVAPQGRRKTRGVLLSIPTLLFGWWSPQGFVWTMIALVWNFRGGADVTDALLPSSISDGQEPRLKRDIERFEKTSRLVGFSIAAFPIVALIVYFLCVK